MHIDVTGGARHDVQQGMRALVRMCHNMHTDRETRLTQYEGHRMSQIHAIILAAGEGTRMKSKTPKVLHKILGRSLAAWVFDACVQAKASSVLYVVGNQAELVQEELTRESSAIAAYHEHAAACAQTNHHSAAHPGADCQCGTCNFDFVVQHERKGTGHAIQIAQDHLKSLSDGEQNSRVIVLSGDSPLITPQTIQAVMQAQEQESAAAVVLTMELANPTGYGRVICNEQGAVERIVEEKDANPAERAVTQCNSGIYCFDTQALLGVINNLSNDNAQGEYYLTDVIELLKQQGCTVVAHQVDDAREAFGVNSRVQLAEASVILRDRINEYWMTQGVTFTDPTQAWIGPEVELASDIEVLPQTFLLGATRVGSDCILGPNTRLIDCTVGEACVLEDVIAKEATIHDRVTAGPRAYLRPKTVLCDDARVGTHVEIKASTVGKGSKVPHLTYLGDAILGERVNIGAGTITCNYDGVTKHKTFIDDDAFIGSDTMLVAPLTVGKHALTGAGSCITKDVPDNALALERAKPALIEDYALRKAQKDK